MWLQVKLCGIRLLVEGEEVDVAVVVVAAAGSAALAGSGLPLLQPLPVLLSQGHSIVPDSSRVVGWAPQWGLFCSGSFEEWLVNGEVAVCATRKILR